MSMETITTVSYMQARAAELHSRGHRIAFVPTMGYLHEGHLSLLDEGRKRAETLVLSIFVNPTQFGEGEDFADYPRDLDRDSELAALHGVDILFVPGAAEIYPADYATYVDVEGLTETLCGASRPGHFRGVCTVVTKLFNIIRPDCALFGTKDFQQLAVIRRMVADLNLPVEIVGMPIHREPDGLAMSSRNAYLSASQRQQALVLWQALQLARRLVAAGSVGTAEILAELRDLIVQQPEARIDYLQICHRDTLAEQMIVDEDSVLLMALYIGSTRLIDNGLLKDAP